MKKEIYTLKMLQQFVGTNDVSGLGKLIPNRGEEFKKQMFNAIREIAKFYHTNGKYPSQHSKDIKEKRLGQKLSYLKQTNKGKGAGVWYPEYDKLAKKLKCQDMFEEVDFLQNGLNAINQIAEFYHKNKKYPSMHAKNIEERRIGKRLSRLRQAKKGKGSCVWYSEYEKEAKKLGCFDMFEDIDRMQLSLDDIKLIADFYHKNKRYPKSHSKDVEEERLGQKRGHLKMAKHGKGNWKWYPEYEAIAKKLGCKDMFISIDYKQNTLDDIKQIAEFYHKNKRYPSKTAKDTEWKKLSCKICTLKIAKQGKGHCKWDMNYDVYAKRLGCKDMFKISK
jgi:hypothetical protein